MEIKRFATSYNYGCGRDGDRGNQEKCKHTIYIYRARVMNGWMDG
jgi:hypothetical protein